MVCLLGLTCFLFLFSFFFFLFSFFFFFSFFSSFSFNLDDGGRARAEKHAVARSPWCRLRPRPRRAGAAAPRAAPAGPRPAARSGGCAASSAVPVVSTGKSPPVCAWPQLFLELRAGVLDAVGMRIDGCWFITWHVSFFVTHPGRRRNQSIKLALQRQYHVVLLPPKKPTS